MGILTGKTAIDSVAAGDFFHAADISDTSDNPAGSSKKVTAAQINTFIQTNLPAGASVQTVNVQDGAVATGTTVLPNDDTIPQNTEGDEFITLAITPASDSNNLKIEIVVVVSSTITGIFTVALFQDSTANALAACSCPTDFALRQHVISFNHFMVSGTASATTFKVRVGMQTTNTTTFNGASGARKLGGVMASSITITEIKV